MRAYNRTSTVFAIGTVPSELEFPCSNFGKENDLMNIRVKVSKETVVLRRWGNKVIWLYQLS